MDITKDDLEREIKYLEKISNAFTKGYKTGVLFQTLIQKRRIDFLLSTAIQCNDVNHIVELLKIENDLLDVDVSTIKDNLGLEK